MLLIKLTVSNGSDIGRLFNYLHTLRCMVIILVNAK